MRNFSINRRQIKRFIKSLGVCAVLLPTGLYAHGTEEHNDSGVIVNTGNDSKGTTLPISIGGDFSLIDHRGFKVSPESYRGKSMLVFFGYVNCKNMCSLTLSRISAALDLLGEEASKITPIVITVDPQRDTPETLGPALEKYHPSLVGLSGSNSQLQEAYLAYQQTPKPVEDDWQGDPVISHSSYIYLMDENGFFQTLFPPILNPKSMADIMRKYITKKSIAQG